MTGSFSYSAAHANYPCFRLKNKTMLILSTPPSPPTTLFAVPRVPFSLSSKPSSHSSSSVYLPRSATAPSLSAATVAPCSCSLAFKIKARDSVVSANMAASVSSRTFLNAQTEQGSFLLPLSSLLSSTLRFSFLLLLLSLSSLLHWLESPQHLSLRICALRLFARFVTFF